MKKYHAIAMWCHLGTFAGLLIPLGNFLLPLILWLSKKDDDALVNDQGKESINFQISIFLYGVVCGILVFVFVGIPLLLVLGLFTLIQVIKASLAASEGVFYRYPFCIRFVK